MKTQIDCFCWVWQDSIGYLGILGKPFLKDWSSLILVHQQQPGTTTAPQNTLRDIQNILIKWKFSFLLKICHCWFYSATTKQLVDDLENLPYPWWIYAKKKKLLKDWWWLILVLNNLQDYAHKIYLLNAASQNMPVWKLDKKTEFMSFLSSDWSECNIILLHCLKKGVWENLTQQPYPYAKKYLSFSLFVCLVIFLLHLLFCQQIRIISKKCTEIFARLF